MKKAHLWTLIAVAILSGTAWFAVSSQWEKPAEETVPATVPVAASPPEKKKSTTLVAARPAIDRRDGYLGSDSCKACHQDYHQSWHTSFHRTMTQPVTPSTAPESIVNGDLVEVQGEKFQFSRRNEGFFVELNDPIANGQRLTRRLVLMTGSHHINVFWYESGIDKTPAQLPITYYIDGQRWIPRKSAFLRPPSMETENELGRWNAICSNCHSTHPRSRPPESNEANWDTRVSDFGISCEACHGPGEAHAAFHQPRLDPQLTGDFSVQKDDLALEETLDQTQARAQGKAEDDVAAQVQDKAGKDEKDPIVNPLNLPVGTRSDMCGQCHGMMMVSIDNATDREDYFSHGRQFRPGDELESAPFLRLVRAGEEQRDSDTFRRFNALPGVVTGHFWPDGQMRVTGRDYTGMIESKCYQKGELSCISCHTMHQQDKELQSEWRDDQLMPEMRGDEACLQCHQEYEDLGTRHTHHPIDSAGSRCMNCHMPHTIYGILKTSRSHTISSPSVATTVETGRPNACNLCHLDHTLQETATHLSDWYEHDVPKLTEEQRTTAASLLHLLSGDAAQRVLQVNAFQWPPAQEASGTDWMRLYLLFGLDDPYDAIRLISQRAYRSLPNTPSFDYDFLDSPSVRGEKIGRQFQAILSKPQSSNKALMIDDQGLPEWSRVESLMKRRNQRPVYLQE